MADADVEAQVAGARAYEELFVAALFGPWAARIADAAQLAPGDRVLDIACGTGVLAREIASRLGPAGKVTGLDPNLGMLTVAREAAPEIDWREGVAESLPFENASFDTVVSQFGLQFFSNPEQALREMARVLRPGGRLVIAVWGPVDSMPAYADEGALLDRLAGARAAEALRAPFALGDRGQLADLVSRSGWAEAQIHTERGTANFPGIRTMVEADLRGWLPVMGVPLTEEQIARVLAEAETVLAPYSTPDGRMVFDVTANIITATKH